MTQPLIVIGTGGNALDILDVVEASNRAGASWDIVGFLDDSKAVGSEFHGIKILGGLRDASQYTGCQFVNAIGSDKSFRKRPEIVAQAGLPAERFATLVHPAATVSIRATLGPGTCINPGAVVAGGVSIGAHVWIGSGCIIGHDTTIEDHAVIAPRALLSGSVRVGTAAYVGGGACVRHRITLGDRALIGLGAVVITDIAANTTVVGNPARVLVRVPRPAKSNDTPGPRAGLSDLTSPSPPPGSPPTGNE